jgi:hypothetical protein
MVFRMSARISQRHVFDDTVRFAWEFTGVGRETPGSV